VTAPDAAAPIVNVAAYHFAPIDDADALTARLRERAEALGLLGTILVAAEGVNLFLAGSAAAVDGFLGELRSDARFAAIAVKRSYSRRPPFSRLKAKRKRETITFRQDGAVPQQERAPALAPADLARWIERGCDDAGRPLVLLDTRNREEIRHGTFAGAMTLPIDRFTDFPAAIDARRDALAGAAVVSFCTGGIRCEKAAPWMRAHGFDNVWQLDGGILGYFEQVGGYGFDGRCFVFDQRVSLDPSLQPACDAA
jgi:UPF0176 protein